MRIVLAYSKHKLRRRGVSKPANKIQRKVYLWPSDGIFRIILDLGCCRSTTHAARVVSEFEMQDLPAYESFVLRSFVSYSELSW